MGESNKSRTKSMVISVVEFQAQSKIISEFCLTSFVLTELVMFIDTGNFYHPSPAQCLVFKAYFKVKNPKFWPFGGPQKYENKNSHNCTIFW